MWFVLTPEDSIRFVSRGIFFVCRDTCPWYEGKVKAVIWILISVMVSAMIATLHS